MLKQIKSLDLFKNVDSSLLKSLIAENKIYIKDYKKNSTIHFKDNRCEMMDIVCDGELTAQYLLPNGSEYILFEFKANNLIGANLLFGEENYYPMDINCKTDCKIVHVLKSAVIVLLKDFTFVIPFVRSLSANSQGLNHKIKIYAHKSLRENIIEYLENLREQYKSDTIILPITKKDLANYLGVQRPSLFRELKKMKDENLIEIDNRKITLKF
ncbi:MAG: Crp/Fnr family transcriptional regulator [Tissierellia bacterium]|nr:Crp/Fnr family transcriptional regulator [Tissierellia bacterium]